MAGHPHSTVSIRERDSGEGSLGRQEDWGLTSQTAKAAKRRWSLALGRASLRSSSAYSVKLHCWRSTRRQWQVAFCHHSFQHVRTRWQSEIGVDQVELVFFSLRHRYEFEPPRAIQGQ